MVAVLKLRWLEQCVTLGKFPGRLFSHLQNEDSSNTYSKGLLGA
jgi:hypothetical protein